MPTWKIRQAFGSLQLQFRAGSGPETSAGAAIAWPGFWVRNGFKNMRNYYEVIFSAFWGCLPTFLRVESTFFPNGFEGML